MATQRHIISVDILSTNRNKLYQIFKSPCVNKTYVEPEKVIFVFDEFDLVIMALHEKELKRKREEEANQNKLENYEKQMKYYLKHSNELDENGIPKNKEPILPSGTCKDTAQINDEITVQHLLELIQGPVPLRGAIFIATTNEFKKIYKICPALFRTGRLTPVFFGYAENDTLNDISMHYYNQTINFQHKVISSISTAEIMNFVECHILEPVCDFQKFESFILENIKPIPDMTEENK
jgi:hypothetical protein